MYDVDEKWKSEDQKEEAAKIICAALHKIAQSNHNLNRGIEGALELRFFGPTYHFVPYRDKQQYQYKQEILRRHKLFQDKKWNALQQRIDYEQDRRNQKKERKYIRDHAPNAPDRMDVDKITREDEEKQSQCPSGPSPQHNHNISAIAGNAAVSTNNTNTDINTNKSRSNANTNPIMSPPTQTNENNMGIYLNELIQNIDEYRYDECDNVNDIKMRIRRCIKYAKLNQFKKADNALNPTKIADLNKPELWKSLLSKYPDEPPLNIDHNIRIQPQYRMNRESIVKIIQNLNKQSCGGPCGMNNELLIWMAEKDGLYVAKAMNCLCKTHIKYGLPKQIRDLLMYAKGVATKKEKKNDVRPICIIASLIRLLDKIAVENVPPETRRAAMGPYQMVDTKEGCEVGSIVADYALDFLKTVTGERMVNADVMTAFFVNSRNIWFTIDKIPDHTIIIFFI